MYSQWKNSKTQYEFLIKYGSKSNIHCTCDIWIFHYFKNEEIKYSAWLHSTGCQLFPRDAEPLITEISCVSVCWLLRKVDPCGVECMQEPAKGWRKKLKNISQSCRYLGFQKNGPAASTYTMKSSMSMDLALFSQKSASCKTLSIFLLILKSEGTSWNDRGHELWLQLAAFGLQPQDWSGLPKWPLKWHTR